MLFRVIGSICNQKFIESLYKVWLCLEINWVILWPINQESLPQTHEIGRYLKALEIEECNLDIGIIKIYTRCLPWYRTGRRVTGTDIKSDVFFPFTAFYLLSASVFDSVIVLLLSSAFVCVIILN